MWIGFKKGSNVEWLNSLQDTHPSEDDFKEALVKMFGGKLDDYELLEVPKGEENRALAAKRFRRDSGILQIIDKSPGDLIIEAKEREAERQIVLSKRQAVLTKLGLTEQELKDLLKRE